MAGMVDALYIHNSAKDLPGNFVHNISIGVQSRFPSGQHLTLIEGNFTLSVGGLWVPPGIPIYWFNTVSFVVNYQVLDEFSLTKWLWVYPGTQDATEDFDTSGVVITTADTPQYPGFYCRASRESHTSYGGVTYWTRTFEQKLIRCVGYIDSNFRYNQDSRY